MVGGLCAFCIADPSRSGLSFSVQTERIPAKSRTVPALDGAAPEEGEIRSQLQRILRSRDFVASLRNRRFLEHVVENTLRGRRVKGHEIGTKVFGRGTEFNATTDPIVRIEAGKLRRDLEMYYLKGGRVDGVHIALAKGAYRAVFSYRQSPTDEVSSPTRGSLIILRAAFARIGRGPSRGYGPLVRCGGRISRIAARLRVLSCFGGTARRTRAGKGATARWFETCFGDP